MQAFGNGDVYVEQLLARARHIEVQVVGRRPGAVSHLGERECTIQRRHQKLIELAPSPWLAPELRERLAGAAVAHGRGGALRQPGHVRVPGRRGDRLGFAFIEANPRLQVEHTVTEEVTGIDLVKTQLELAGGPVTRRPGARARPMSPAPGASPCRCGSTWRRWAPTARPGRRAARSTAFEVAVGRRASGSTPSATPATAPTPASTPCWPS